MSVSDERLDQLANDPMMCNITVETQSVLRETITLRATVAQQAATISELRKLLWDAGVALPMSPLVEQIRQVLTGGPALEATHNTQSRGIPFRRS
jgi:hypothetical protein